MRFIFAFLFFIGIKANAQAILLPMQSSVQGLWPMSTINAKANKIRVQKLVTLSPSSADSNITTIYYDTAGRIMENFISSPTNFFMLYTNWTLRTDFFYTNNGQLIGAKQYENDSLKDITIIRKQAPQYRREDYHEGKLDDIDEVFGDSLHQFERYSYLDGNDTMKRLVETTKLYNSSNQLLKKTEIFSWSGYKIQNPPTTNTSNYYYMSNNIEQIDSSDGKQIQHLKTYRDAISNTDTVTFFDTQGKAARTNIDSCNDEGKAVLCKYYDEKNRLVWKLINQYDNNGNLSSYTYFNAKGKLDSQVIYKYNSQNLIVEEKHLKQKGKVEEIIGYQYEYYQ